MPKITARATLALLGIVVLPFGARAQGLEAIGGRGAAMAAFVAVADDATAVVWNPAGLLTGPIFNMTLGLGRSTAIPDDPPARGQEAGKSGATALALGTWPVGLAYYRISTGTAHLAIASPSVLDGPDRQEDQVVIRTLVTSHLGATVQQSIGNFVTVGATVKLVRGSMGQSAAADASWDQAFERSESVGRIGSTRGDLDVGALVAAGRLRAGVVVRNVTAPTFGDDDQGGTATLDRHARLGVAWGDRWPGVARTLLSLDADLTRVAHPAGERRDVAAGVERWLRGQQVGVRAGLRASTVGAARPVLSAGGSYAVRSGTFVDGYVAWGTRDERGWGIAARLSY